MPKKKKKINWRWVLTTGILSGIVCVLFVTFFSKSIAEGITMGVGVFFFCLEAFGKIKLGGWSPLIIVIATGISFWGAFLHMDDITELKGVEG